MQALLTGVVQTAPIDGLVSSMITLHAARHPIPVPTLARSRGRKKRIVLQLKHGLHETV